MPTSARRWIRSGLALASFAFALTTPLRADEPPPAEAPPEVSAEVSAEEPAESGLQWKLGVEAKLHYRHSDDNSILNPNFPINVGRPVFLSTVDPGSHIELSTVTLVGDASWGEHLAGNVRIDVGNLYDRNPTSTGKKVIVHDAWLRLGREARPAVMPEGSGGYFKLGKFAHFERQDDRHLESWGLLSTAFNRFSDVGFEGGVELGRFVYAKASITTGNPLFIRDPNALAGDNGTDALLRPPPNDVPKLGSGFVIPYDTEVQDIGNGSNPQTSVGLGFHFSDESGQNGVDVLAWGRERKLADTVELEGTFYGGDLDLLNGPFSTSRLGGPFSLPLTDDKKKEAGANVWVYWGGLSVFGQYVDQKVAGMKRKGIEGEVAWRFDLPVVWGLAGRQLFPHIQPALRYSKLEPEFRGGSPKFPAPSVRWDWEKIDAGLRVTIIEGLDVTAEYSKNEFVLLNGTHRENNESLVTFRWKM